MGQGFHWYRPNDRLTLSNVTLVKCAFIYFSYLSYFSVLCIRLPHGPCYALRQNYYPVGKYFLAIAHIELRNP